MSTFVLDRSNQWAARRLSLQALWRILSAILIVSDILALVLAFGLAYAVRFNPDIPFFEDVQPAMDLHFRLAAFGIVGWILILAAFHSYDPRNLFGGTREYSNLFSACSVATCVFILLTFFIPVIRLARGAIALTWIFAIVFLGIERFAFRRVVYELRRHGLLTSRSIIVGTDGEAYAIAQQLLSTPTIGAQLLGFVSDHNLMEAHPEHGPQLIGTLDALPEIVERLGVDELIVSTATLPRESLISIFQMFANSDRVELRFSSGLYELFTTGVAVRELGNVPLVTMNKVRLNEMETLVKTLMDKVIGLVALMLLAPLFLIIAVLIKLDSRGPVFYRRHVVGRGGREFDAFKFRTMYPNGSEILEHHPELKQSLQLNLKLKDDPRVTPIGRWLRRYSLDELPQLINIVGGSMSLVGPRMITPPECALYGKWRLNLLTVKPGLTGLWQIKGRSDLSFDERIRLDMYYIRNYSIWLDIQILSQTIPVVLSGKGAY